MSRTCACDSLPRDWTNRLNEATTAMNQDDLCTNDDDGILYLAQRRF
jgi:hypothetical protein